MDSTNVTPVALITGAGSGLGEATAHAFARAEYAVALLDRDGEGVSHVAGTLREKYKANALPLRCDVRDADAVAASVAEAADRLGRLDVAVNCAGVDHTVSVEEMTVEQWDQVLEVNLRGPFLVARAAMPIMRRQGGGHIVNIASTAALRQWANAAAYHASKAGLIAFGRGLGVEGRPHNIRVTTVIPGGMRTHFFDRFVEQGIPMPDWEKLQDPANVAAVILAAVRMPPESVLQEVLVTPPEETSWP